MARPKGSKNKSTLAKQSDDIASEKGDDWTKGLDNAKVLSVVQDRFNVMNRMTQACADGSVRGLIISGAPGIGKTYTVETMLADRYTSSNGAKRHKIIKGAISGIGLYKTLYDYQNEGNVVMLDDSDSIFFDDVGISILKAALDSSPNRWITWNTEAASIMGADSKYEDTFEYRGTMVFITNTDFQGIVDKGKSKLAPHFNALMSRTIYLDLMVHHRRAVAVWVNYVVRRTKLLQTHYHISREQEHEAIDWILSNYESLRTLSLRDAMKVGQFMQTDPDDWKSLAEVTLLRDIKY